LETQQGVAKAKTREEVQGSVENRPPLLNLPIPPATLPILNNSKTAKKKVQSRQGATHAAWADIAGQPSTSARRVFCDPRTEDWRKSENKGQRRPAHPPLPSLGIPSDIQHSHPLLQAWPERRGRACARVQITKEDKPPEAARLVTPPSSIRWGTEIKLLHPPTPRTRSFPSSKNSGC